MNPFIYLAAYFHDLVLVVWVSCEQNPLQRPPTQRRHLDLSGVCFAFWGHGAGVCEMIWWINCCYTVCWSLDPHNCYIQTHTHVCTHAHTVLDLEILPRGASVLFSSVLPPPPYSGYGNTSFVLLQLCQLLALQAGSQVVQDLILKSGPSHWNSHGWILMKMWNHLRDGRKKRTGPEFKFSKIPVVKKGNFFDLTQGLTIK